MITTGDIITIIRAHLIISHGIVVTRTVKDLQTSRLIIATFISLAGIYIRYTSFALQITGVDFWWPSSSSSCMSRFTNYSGEYM